MPDRLDLYFRAHTIPVKKQEERATAWRAETPEFALIFHCATTADEKQNLLFGAYICAQLIDGNWVAKEIGLFGRDGHPNELRVLKRFVKDSAFELGTEEEFRRKLLLKYLKAGALIVAYDVPFQISRIAVKSNKALKKARAFSFYFRLFEDTTGQVRPSGYEPGLSIESLDASKAIFRLIKYKFHTDDGEREEEQQASNAHILDLKTMTAVLTGEAYTLASAFDVFSVPASRSRKRQSRITKSAIESLLRTVTAELDLLNRFKDEFKRHGVDLVPERCFSPASLAKGDFTAMGLQSPEKKFGISARMQGIAEQALFAGRSECTIRRTLVPVTYSDFHAQFSAINSLLGCREIVCAQRLEFADFTEGARELLAHVTLDECFRPEFWNAHLRWFALVEPQDDVLPVRAKFGQHENSDPTLGWNFLTSKQPFWISAPDAVAAKLMTGKPIKILEAIKVVPCGLQPGLMPINLFSQLTVNPLRDDLAVKLIELRDTEKRKSAQLASGLKVAANSAAFGIFCQMDVKDLDSPSQLNVFSGEANYLSPPDRVWEQPAEFYCPVFASLVTGGSHLLCAMLERCVRDSGGHIAAMDTDSAMIVSKREGGFVPCVGGQHRLEEFQAGSGHDAIQALSWAQVDHIRERFEALNPWRDTLRVPFLKLEKENFSSDGERRQLYAYCVSAKLYCLFNLDENGLLIRKPSGHGLGFLQAPYSSVDWQRRRGKKWKEDLPPWIYEAWHLILSRELGLPYQPPRWLKQPAVMAVPITTPQVLERLGCFKDVLRPFTVVMVPFPKKDVNLLWTGYFILPYWEKLQDLHGRPMINVASGAIFYIYEKASAISRKPLGWLELGTVGDEINRILFRAESKFCTPNGAMCTGKTIGLLVRRHIVAGEFHYIGKEASTRWGSGLDLSMMAEAGLLDPMDKTFREYERIVDPNYLDEIRAAAKQFSTKLLSRKSTAAECAIRNFKKGKNTIRPRTLRKLTRAIHDLQNKAMMN